MNADNDTYTDFRCLNFIIPAFKIWFFTISFMIGKFLFQCFFSQNAYTSIAVYAYFLASMCIYEKNSDLLTHQSLYRLWLNKCQSLIAVIILKTYSYFPYSFAFCTFNFLPLIVPCCKAFNTCLPFPFKIST